ncbi:MAG: phosphate acyltransferase [Spirochaetaceae bacterium]
MKKRVAVIMSQSSSVLKCVKHYKDDVDFILIGNILETKEKAKSLDLDLNSFELINECNDTHACDLGSSLIVNNRADIIMKGIVHTGTFMKSLFSHKTSLISLVSRFEIPTYHKPLYITDAGINISPNLEQKIQILQNSIDVVKSLGVINPKVACICPVEVVNSKLQSTVDAKALSDMEFTNTIVEGPISFDIAVSKKAADIKGFNSEISGDVDILLMPDLNSSNPLYKSLTLFANAKVSSVVAGLSFPVVLTSRADSTQVKIDSLKLALDMK